MARWTQEQYEELKAAVATGAAEIQFKDKRIRYQGRDSMLKLLRRMEQDLGITPKKKSSGTTMTFNNGL
jgi:hypothetical protein